MMPRWILLTCFQTFFVLKSQCVVGFTNFYQNDGGRDCEKGNLWLYKVLRMKNIWLQAWSACQLFWSCKKQFDVQFLKQAW